MDRALRVLIAQVLVTRGCGCCEGKYHAELKDELAKALNVPNFPDGSGHDWWALAGEGRLAD